jgi:hypothetical protein
MGNSCIEILGVRYFCSSLPSFVKGIIQSFLHWDMEWMDCLDVNRGSLEFILCLGC